MHAVLFAVAAGTGLRAGELYALSVSDVDLERKTIKVWRSAFDGEYQTPKNQELSPHGRNRGSSSRID
jgi:integrase